MIGGQTKSYSHETKTTYLYADTLNSQNYNISFFKMYSTLSHSKKMAPQKNKNATFYQILLYM